MMNYNELIPARADTLVPHADRLRLAVAAYLARRWPSETVRWRPVPNDGHYGMWSACREVFDDHLPGPGVLQHPRRQLVNGMGRGPRAALIGPVMPQRPRTLLPRRVLCEF
jgi:hypothetical protein